MCTTHGLLSGVGKKKKKIPTSSPHCLLCRQTRPWCTTPCSWSPSRPSGPLRWPSAPCSVTATSPGALDRASWTSSKRSVSDKGPGITDKLPPLHLPLLHQQRGSRKLLLLLAWPPCIIDDVFLCVLKALQWAHDPSFKASVANLRLKSECQITPCDMLLHRSPLTGRCFASESTQHEDIYGIYVLISLKRVAWPDCQTGCLQTEMRPLMHECFDLLSLKSSRGPLPAMEREHYHSIPLLIFSSSCPPSSFFFSLLLCLSESLSSQAFFSPFCLPLPILWSICPPALFITR